MEFSEFNKQYKEILKVIEPIVVEQLESIDYISDSLSDIMDFAEYVCNRKSATGQIDYNLVLTEGLPEGYYDCDYETNELSNISIKKGYSIWRIQEEKCGKIEKELLAIEQDVNHNWIISFMIYKILTNRFRERLIKSIGIKDFEDIYNVEQLYNWINNK